MTGQRTLEEVGVKRARQEGDTKPTSNSEAVSESQPLPKKAHTESDDAKQNKDSAQSKAKENQGSQSNATPQQKSVSQDTAASQPKKSQTESKPAESESKKGDTKPETPAAEAAAGGGEADPKPPLSTAVAKPEGDNDTITHIVASQTRQYYQLQCCLLPSITFGLG